MATNAIQLLTEDHARLRTLLDELEQTRGDGRREKFEEVRQTLAAHEIIEEEEFYPTLRRHPRAKEEVLEGIEEHHLVDQVMGELGATPISDETWEAKRNVMTENIRHHMEEEETELFPTARKVLDEGELNALGDRMASRKTEVLRELS